jgi:hypothetical protein
MKELNLEVGAYGLVQRIPPTQSAHINSRALLDMVWSDSRYLLVMLRVLEKEMARAYTELMQA